MDVILIYLYVMLGIAVFLFLQQYFRPRPTSRIHSLYGLFIRHLKLPYIVKRRTLFGPLTRLQAISYGCFIVGTITCNIIKVPTLQAARGRAGALAILHLALISIVPCLSLGATFFGVSLPTFYKLHWSIGVMGAFQSLLHVLLSVRLTPLNLQDTDQRDGFIVS
jgi:hypothetical protein